MMKSKWLKTLSIASLMFAGASWAQVVSYTATGDNHFETHVAAMEGLMNMYPSLTWGDIDVNCVQRNRIGYECTAFANID